MGPQPTQGSLHSPMQENVNENVVAPRGRDAAQALAVLVAAAVAVALRAPWVATAAGASWLLALLVSHRGRYTPGGALGIANLVTLGRLGMIVVLATLGPRAAGPALALLVLSILVLDGVDGWLARRLGLASPFGARFDMECDALLVLTCSLVLFASGRLPAFILVPGLLRYLYVLTCLLFLHGAPEQPRSRAAGHVFVVMVLSFAASFWSVARHEALALGASLLLVWSFARSFAFSLGARFE